jgi:hypothetical protein
MHTDDTDKKFVLICVNLCPIYSFNVNGRNVKLLTTQHLDREAGAGGAVGQFAGQGVLLATILAFQPGRNALKVQFGPGTQAVFADNVPIKLHGIVDDAGQLADNQVNGRYPLGFSLFGVALGNGQNVLGHS